MLHPSNMPAAVRKLLPEKFDLVSPEQGETSEVAFVRASGRPDTVVKRARGPVYSQWLAREAKVLATLELTELPIPRVLGYHAVPSSSGDESWLLMSRVPGERAWPQLTGADARARRALLTEVGSVLARIHSTPVPVSFHEDATPWLDRHRLCAAEFAFDDELLESFGPAAVPDGGVRTLIHGDLTLDNVLAQDGHISGVIDWGGCGVGDPRFDITLALATAPELPLQPDDLRAFFRGYAGAKLPGRLRTMVETLYR